MRYVFVYDGECDFCRDSVSWLQIKFSTSVACLPYQALPLDELGLSAEE